MGRVQMTDFQFLLLVLGLLYLSECLFRVRRGSVVVSSWFSRRAGAAIANPSPGMGSRRTGLVFLNPLPPLGMAFVCHAWPVSMTRDAAYSFVTTTINGYDRADHTCVHILWDDMWKIERKGDQILVNEKAFARCNGERLAELMVAVMRRVKAAPRDRRDALIARALARAASSGRIRREMRRFALVAGGPSPLRWQAHLLMLVIFGLLPAAIGLPFVRPYLLPSLALLALLLVVQGATFFSLHKRLYPGFVDERWRATLTMVLTPTASIRACDSLSQHFLAAYQPLAVALVLGRGRRLEEFVRRQLLDVRHPMPSVYPSENSEERTTAEAFGHRLAAVLDRAVSAAGLDPVAAYGPARASRSAGKILLPAL